MKSSSARSQPTTCYRHWRNRKIGGLTNRDGRWYAVRYEGQGPADWPSSSPMAPPHRSADARAIADTMPSARGVTVSGYLRTRWLPTRKGRLRPTREGQLRPTTSFRCEQMIDRYVLPHIGRVPLRSLTITHLEDLYAHLRCSGSHHGGPLAPMTVLNVHQILRTVLGDAERAASRTATSPG